MRTKKLSLSLALWLGSGACLPAWGEVNGDTSKSALIQFKGSGIEIDLKQHEVRMDADVCLAEGILEFLICLPDTYEHEAVFVTKCKPSLLHIALVLIGLEPSRFALGGFGWGDTGTGKDRSRVNMEVEYEENGRKTRCKVSELLVSREHEDGEVPDRWVFAGSIVVKLDGKKVYAADRHGVVAGIIPGSGVIQFAEKTGNPYRNEQEGLEANSDTIPAKGTRVKLVFTPFREVSKRKTNHE